jgi:hypothetical protein
MLSTGERHGSHIGRARPAPRTSTAPPPSATVDAARMPLPGRAARAQQAPRRVAGPGHDRRLVRRQPARLRAHWRQRRARSDRNAATAAFIGTDPPARPPARSRISSNVGRLASSTSRARRYSWSDWWAAAARWRNTASVCSGTSLIWMLGIAPFWRPGRRSQPTSSVTWPT